MSKLKEQKIFDELVEKKPKLLLKPLSDYPAEGTKKSQEFEIDYGTKGGIYIPFLKSALPNNISAKKLFEGLFSENYIENALYIGMSTNILERGTAMRGNSMNDSPHAIAKYRKIEEVDTSDIILLSILISEDSKALKDWETSLQDFNKQRIGKRFIAEGLSSVNGVEGTKHSGIISNITSSTDIEELESFLNASATRITILRTAIAMGQPL